MRYYGQWMRDEAQRRIGHLYPKVKVTEEMASDRPDLEPYVGQELTVIAWLWARTVKSPNPAAGGTHVPLLKSYWLSTKKGQEAFVQPVVDAKANSFEFRVKATAPPNGFDPACGTVIRSGATCLLTNSPLSLEHIRDEAKAGRMKSRLTAIVCQVGKERVLLSPTKQHEQATDQAHPVGYPETSLPEKALSFRVQLYGMDQHYKLFTPRQLV